MNDVQEQKPEKRERIISVRFLVFILLVAALVPVAYYGWSELYSNFIERTPPEILVTHAPRGIGLGSTAVRLKLSDRGAGLDEIVVRASQRNVSREIFRQSLGGQAVAEVNIEFPGDKSTFEEGMAELEIRTFDRSFWNNSRELRLVLKIDYRKPRLEVVSAQHNARLGGSQLIFYRAFDEDLAISGVKIGEDTFIGYPAKGIDSDFEDKSLFVCVYALDIRKSKLGGPPRLFAEDGVGNQALSAFPNRIAPKSERQTKVTVSEDFLLHQVADLADRNFQKVDAYYQKLGERVAYRSAKGGRERLIEKFKLVNEKLRRINEEEIYSSLKGPRFESFWNTAFALPSGSVQSAFGDQVNYIYDGEEIGRHLQTGYELLVPRDNNEVSAAHEGIIVFSENIGVYGSTVAIDHGLGLVSLYSHLDNVSVSRGDKVNQGQRLGSVGRSGFSRNLHVYFEMRVQGVPVSPLEWWDKSWFYGHVTNKINEVKQTLGMPVYRPLG